MVTPFSFAWWIVLIASLASSMILPALVVALQARTALVTEIEETVTDGRGKGKTIKKTADVAEAGWDPSKYRRT